VLCCSIVTVQAQDRTPLQLKQTIALPGVEGRIDHFALDPAGDRLFVCALGNNTVEVLDLRKGQRIHSITGLGAPQGIAYIPEPDRLFVANDKGGICKIYDAKSYQAVGEINLKDDADNVRYDDASKRIYVGFGTGGIGIISASEGKIIGAIRLPGHPESFELEKQGHCIFVNVPNARQVAVIDREKSEVITTWKTDGALGNFPMAFDEANHRLLIGCRTPPKLVVLDTESGNVVAASTSPAIPMMSFTTASAVASTRYAARARSTSSSKLTQTPIRPSLELTRRMALALGFSCRNETTCLLLFPIAAVRQRRFAVTKSNNLSEVVG
jgi:WD40 repeat protein